MKSLTSQSSKSLRLFGKFLLNAFNFNTHTQLIVNIALAVMLFSYQYCFSTVNTYSSPGDLSLVPHLKQSTDYTVTVNGKSSFVYESDNSYDGGLVPTSIRSQKKAAFTNFDFANETVTVKVSCNFTVNTVDIRPKNDSVTFTRSGNTITFTLTKSKYLSVEVNDRLKPLFIFADSLETPPAASLVFGPGIHNIGSKFPIASEQTVYIAGGAVVVGSFISNGKNLKICGRGILNSGTVLNAEWNLDKNLSPLAAVGGTLNAYELNGITIVNSPGWHVNAYGPDCKFNNLKCIAWAAQTDGPHLNGTSTMTHCFIFNNDDALITNKGDNNFFRDCVVFKGPYGRPMISFGDNSQNNLLWDNIDIIGNETAVGVLWGKMFTIATSATGASVKQNLVIKNIRIEGQLANKAGFICIDANGTTTVRNVLFENITTELLRTTAINLEGSLIEAPGATIDGVTFKGVNMNGTIISSLTQGAIQAVGSPINVKFDNAILTESQIVKFVDSTQLKIFINKEHQLKIEAGDLTFDNVSIYNSIGYLVKKGKLSTIDTQSLNKGIHFVQTENKGNVYFGKFIK